MPPLVNPADLAQKHLFLVLSSPSTIRERNIQVTKELSSLGYRTIVVTTNFPYSILSRLYTEGGVDPKTLLFIDAVTRHSMGSAENIPGVVRYVNHPADLTEMSIAVTEALKDTAGQKVCILYDSISTMLIYLASPNISRFIHFVTNKLRLMDISGVFLAAEKGLDPMLLSQLTSFVDTVIDTE